MSTLPYEILIRGNAGVFRGAHAIDEPGGNARPLTEADLALFGPGLDTSLMTRIGELESEIITLNNPAAPPSQSSERTAARAAMRAQWDSLPDWIRGPFHHQFIAANALLDAGQDGAAAALIQCAEAPTAYTSDQVTAFNGVKAALAVGIESIPS